MEDLQRVEEEVKVQEGLQTLLDDIGRVQMLNHDEFRGQLTRFRLGRRELEGLVQRAGLPLEELIHWARRRAKREDPPWPWPPLSREDRRALLAGIDGEAALLEIVEANLRLVVHIAKRYGDDPVPMEERVSEGAFGLIRAVEMFDASRGYRFSTYAFHWVRQAISRLLERRSSIFKVSGEEVRRYRKSLRQEEPVLASETPVEEDLEAAFSVLSLDYTVSEEGTSTLQDLIEGDSDPVEEGERRVLRETVIQELKKLPAEQAALLAMTHGLFGPELTLAEAGKALGLERETAIWHYEHGRARLKESLSHKGAVVFVQT